MEGEESLVEVEDVGMVGFCLGIFELCMNWQDV